MIHIPITIDFKTVDLVSRKAPLTTILTIQRSLCIKNIPQGHLALLNCINAIKPDAALLKLAYPTDSTTEIMKYISKAFDEIYIEGIGHKKFGIINNRLYGLSVISSEHLVVV